MYAEISVLNYAGKNNQTFSYKFNSDAKPTVGSVVKVVFAKKPSLGVIRKLHNIKPRGVKKILGIEKVLDYKIPKANMELADWMIEYYASSSQSVWQLFMPRNIASKPRTSNKKNKYINQSLLSKLNEDQTKSLSEIENSKKPVLLQGVMGSGKTEIYFHLIESALSSNKSSILLMPEIFLTKQILQRAEKHFGEKLIVTHSNMTQSERRNAWVECNMRSQNEAVVVIGPRSSLFMPIFNLGLIIIDESHESSYKQESSPRYSTDYVAARLSNIAKSKMVMGSATPSVISRYLADVGKIKLVKLGSRAVESEHPEISLVDVSSQKNPLSKQLESALSKNLSSNKISMLYINRRGTAPMYMCNDCSKTLECSNCGVNLHLHSDQMRLVCHICSYRMVPPAKCPECGGNDLKGIGLGTKALEQLLKDKFPKAKVLRIDRDSKPNIINNEEINKSDIIVGTQMIARGIDISKLDLVGIPFADYDLAKIDFNSRERAFQLITQAAGRAGRRKQRGKVYIQTRKPDNEIYEFITANDYEAFYKSELEKRKEYSYPPFSYLLKLECGNKAENSGKTKILKLINQLSNDSSLEFLGPAQSHPAIRSGKYMWSITIKSRSRKKLQDLALSLDSSWKIDLDPYSLL